jgi:hypothetical protein
MAAAMIEITGLSECQPLFQEFCKVRGLKDGDFYKAIDYLHWVDGLTLAKQLEIIRKYIPGFKMKNCNL